MTYDEIKNPNIADKVKDYIDTMDGNLSDLNYISTKPVFEGFIMETGELVDISEYTYF